MAVEVKRQKNDGMLFSGVSRLVKGAYNKYRSGIICYGFHSIQNDAASSYI